MARKLEFVQSSDIQIPPSRVEISRQYVAIQITLDETYRFDLDRCDTPSKLLGWVHHLSQKRWIDGAIISDLVSRVSSRFGWDIYGM